MLGKYSKLRPNRNTTEGDVLRAALLELSCHRTDEENEREFIYRLYSVKVTVGVQCSRSWCCTPWHRAVYGLYAGSRRQQTSRFDAGRLDCGVGQGHPAHHAVLMMFRLK